MRLDNINWFIRFIETFKIRLNNAEVLEVPPIILPVIDISRPMADTYNNTSVNDAASGTLLTGRVGQRFVLTHIAIRGKAATTDGTLSITGYLKGNNSTIYVGYTSVAAGYYNDNLAFNTPIIFDAGTNITFTVLSAGAGSSHTAIIGGYFV